MVPKPLFALCFTVVATCACRAEDDAGGASTGTAVPASTRVIGEFLWGWAAPEGAETDAATVYPRRVRRTKDSMVMVLVPAATFQTGAVPGDAEADGAEKPRHAVTLSTAYYIDETEVTVAMWNVYAAETGTTPPTLRPEAGSSHPIHAVSWDWVQGYVRWAHVALPTEAQWECAGKGGHDEYVYPWGAMDDVKKRNGAGEDDGFEGLAPVKSYAANGYGLYEMSGNVYEWCADRGDAGFYKHSLDRDPAGPKFAFGSNRRVSRGGAFSVPSRFLRVSFRGQAYSGSREKDQGFRCAKSLP